MIDHEQATKLKTYANSKGVELVGDFAIYPAFDSADVWGNKDLFQLSCFQSLTCSVTSGVYSKAC